jgi:hypothetical protein
MGFDMRVKVGKVGRIQMSQALIGLLRPLILRGGNNSN